MIRLVMNILRDLALVLVIALFLTPMRSAAADGEADEAEARRAAFAILKNAEDAYEDGFYEIALDRFLDAYETFPHPGFHARIGACHQALGDHDAAIESFERFIEEVPDAPNRAEVEDMLAVSLQAIGEDTLPLATLAPEDDEETSEDYEPIDDLEMSDLTTSPGLVPDLDEKGLARDESRDDPLYRRWWFVTAVGVSVVAVVGGATYAGSQRGTEYVLPSGSLGSLEWR